jgi:WD40 repeat protein
MASAGIDGDVRLSEVRTGRVLTAFQVDVGGVHDVALSGDGQLLASGSGNGTVHVWDTGSGQLRHKLRADQIGVWSVALTDEGRLLASGSADGSVRIWDTRTAACLRTLRADRHYERLDITGLTGVTETQRAALLALGAVERADEASTPTPN